MPRAKVCADAKNQDFRVVSLVPSLTEALVILGGRVMLVGRTRFCTHPAFALRHVQSVGGTKNPDLSTILRLKPDLILASKEENRKEDLEGLAKAGLLAWISRAENPHEAFFELEEIKNLLGLTDPRGLASNALRAYERLLRQAQQARPVRTLCLVWKEPLMAVGSSTYAGSLMEAARLQNCLKGRYPRLTMEDLVSLDPGLVLLPDEPYHFGPRDAMELRLIFERAGKPIPPIRLLRGRNIFWPGLRAPFGLRALLSQPYLRERDKSKTR
ncbi:MAG: helical backbone metal receptor [Nitrospirota bacterium]|nr:helical backbone metal receptor [Nitrospirota bacterium]